MDKYLQIIIPAIVAIVSTLSGIWIAKNTNKKDLTINDRQQLSEDEKAFRQELKEMIESYKKELQNNREEIKALREEVATLLEANLNLTLENKTLQVKVDELQQILVRFEKEKKEEEVVDEIKEGEDE